MTYKILFYVLVACTAYTCTGIANRGKFCDIQCPEIGYFPHPIYCSKFCQCDNFGTAHEKECPNGLNWVQDITQCRFAICVDKTTTPPLNITTPKPENPQCDFICPRDGKFPHPTYSWKYCDCQQGIPDERECSQGFSFNQTSEACEEFSFTTGDCDAAYSQLNPRCFKTCEILGPGLHRGSICNHYCLCRNNHRDGGRHRACPVGMVFNHLIENCDYPWNYECSDSSLVPANYKCPAENGRFEYPDCCPLFISCSDYIPFTTFCSANTHFSIKTKRCEHPQIAGCNGRDGTKCGFRCEGDQLFKHGTHCSKYCQCVHGEPQERYCPLGSDFNPDKKFCDDAEEVRCGYKKCDFSCVSVGNFPHLLDCSKYCSCSRLHETADERKCEPGLQYSEGSRSCTDQETGLCIQVTTSTASSTDQTSTYSTEEETWTDEPDPVCPEKSGLFPHPLHNNRYIYCENGYAEELFCRGDDIFNPEFRSCVPPDFQY